MIDGLKAMILSLSTGLEDLSKKKDFYVEVHQGVFLKLDWILLENWERDTELSLFFLTQLETT